MKTTENTDKAAVGKAVANLKVKPLNDSTNQVFFQAKLQLGNLGKDYGRKVDKVADRAMRMPEPFDQHQIALEEEENNQMKPQIQQKITNGRHSETAYLISQAPLLIQKESAESGGQPPFRIALNDLDVVNPRAEVINTVREAFEPIVAEANRSLEIIEGGVGDLNVLFSNNTVQYGSCGRTYLGNEGGSVWVGSHLALRICCDPSVESCRYPHLNLFVGEGTQLGRFIGNTAVHELAHQLGVGHNDTNPNNYMYDSDSIPVPVETRTLENMRAYFSQHLTFSFSQTFQMMMNISRNSIPGGMGYVQNQDEQEATTAPDVQEKALNGNELIQPKLTIGKPDDEYEQEADRVANQVMRMPEPFIKRQINKEDEPDQSRRVNPPKNTFSNTQINNKDNEASNSIEVSHPWKPIAINKTNQQQIIQRRLNYIALVTGQQAAPYLTAFDNTVTQVEQSLVGVTGPAANDIRAAMARARTLRSAGRVTCWQISGGLYYASYDNATDQLRLHTNWGVGRPTSRQTVVHESIHALHGSQHPRLRRLYAQVLAAGGTPNVGLATVLLQFKAWTEYWAYRRAAEHYNLVNPQFATDAHRSALGERDVRASIARVAQISGSAFTPWTWSPPRRLPGVRRRRP